MNKAINCNNINQVRQIGLDILEKELGITGLIIFLKQFENGYGDYTKERNKILADFTIDDIVSGICKP
jgi:hypothetical protein